MKEEEEMKTTVRSAPDGSDKYRVKMRQSLTINVGSWAGAKSCGGKNKDFFLRPKFSSILPFWGGQFIASQIIIFSVTGEKWKRREASKPANPSSSQLSLNGLPGTGNLPTAFQIITWMAVMIKELMIVHYHQFIYQYKCHPIVYTDFAIRWRE